MKRFFLMFAVLAIIGSAFGAGQCPVPDFMPPQAQENAVHLGGATVSKCFATGLNETYDYVLSFDASASAWENHRVTISDLDNTSDIHVAVFDADCEHVLMTRLHSTGQGTSFDIDLSYAGASFKLIISGTNQDDISVAWSEGTPVTMGAPTLCSTTSLDQDVVQSDEWRSFNLSGIQDHKIYKAPLQPGRYWSRGRVIEVR